MNQIVANNAKKHANNIVLEQSISENADEIGRVSFSKLKLVLKNYFALFNALRASKPSLVYFALSPLGFAFLKDLISVAIIKFFGTPIVYHLHGKGISDASEKVILKSLYTFVFKNQYAITLSKYLDYDVENFGLKKIYNIGNGIEDIDPEKFPKTNEGFILTFLSNYVKEKGIIEFIELISELKARNVQVKAQIIGKSIDITEEQLINLINEKGVGKSIIHCGAAYGEEKLRLLGNTSVFVFPTYYTNECYPLVLLEAKRFGIPIITSKEGGIRDIVCDGINGFITDPKNIDELAKKVILLKNDDVLRLNIRKINRIEFLESHTIKEFLDNIEATIKDVLLEVKLK
jgi:glycosyltransferase involved in cell wall biosynthesis